MAKPRDEPIKSALLESISGIEYGFGTLADPFPANFSPDHWLKTKPEWKQIHGTQITHHSEPQTKLGECDGIFTTTKFLPIAIVTADCVPILLARKDGIAISVLHAGWRGTLAEIVSSWADFLKKNRDDPTNWVAVLGPSISGNIYEVSEELISQFEKKFPDIDYRKMVPKARHLDLHAVNAHQLIRVGVRAIEKIQLCTQSTQGFDGTYRFHSYRREGASTRQYSALQIGNSVLG